MNAFLDSSTLVKLYHAEADSEVIMACLSQGIGDLYLSELALLEFSSAIWRKVRERKLNEETARAVIGLFRSDEAEFKWIALDRSIVDRAAGLLSKYGIAGLRSLDAIQLASALVMKDAECVFLTSDQLLKRLFIQEGLNVPF